jgi:hypothetical protein
MWSMAFRSCFVKMVSKGHRASICQRYLPTDTWYHPYLNNTCRLSILRMLDTEALCKLSLAKETSRRISSLELTWNCVVALEVTDREFVWGRGAETFMALGFRCQTITFNIESRTCHKICRQLVPLIKSRSEKISLQLVEWSNVSNCVQLMYYWNKTFTYGYGEQFLAYFPSVRKNIS